MISGSTDTPLTKSQKRQAAKAKRDKRNPTVLQPRSDKQRLYIEALNSHSTVIGLGSAGSGKTYVAARHALQRLASGQIERIVITRPNVASPRHKLGFQPGNGDQKMKPWMAPIFAAFRDGAKGADLERYQNNKQIEILPFEFMQGHTVADGVFLLDEAQNCTLEDLEMFVSRIGENAQGIICGDPHQTRLLEDSGLTTFADIAIRYEIDCGIVHFNENDVVRSATAAEWVRAFAAHRKTHGIAILQK